MSPVPINQAAPPARQLLPARRVAERYQVHLGTLWRWIERGAIPPPFTILNRVRYWDLAELEAADRRRTREAAAAKSRATKPTNRIEDQDPPTVA